MQNVLVINALNGSIPLVLQKKYPDAKITCAEVFPFFKQHLTKLGFTVVDWNSVGDMKFDLVIGNPPYQSIEATTKKLWPKFVERANSLVENDGYVAMVTPSSWLNRPQGQSNKPITQEIFAKKQLLWINTDTNEHFQIGETVCSWCYKNQTKDNTVTKITHKGVTQDVEYGGQAIALDIDQKIVFDILEKLNVYKGSRLKDHVYNDVDCSLSIEKQIQQKLLFTASKANMVAVYWTAANTGSYWMPKKYSRIGLKIILNRSGYYFKEDAPNKYMQIDDKHTYAIGAGAYGLPMDSMQNAKNMMSVLTSKLYQFYVNNEKTSGFNTGIGKLPYLDPTKKWTDKDLYQLYNLTETEIDFVESNYKQKFKAS